jgi:hypothetical protein
MEAREVCVLFLLISHKFNTDYFLVTVAAGKLSAVVGTSSLTALENSSRLDVHFYEA